MTPLQRLVTALSAAALLVAVLVSGAATEAGAATVQAQCGNTQATPTLTVDRPTIGVDETAVVTVTGSSYLLPPHVCGTEVFGGIYLFFGWVQPGGVWGPSNKSSTSSQGLFGTTYSYPGEGGGAETRDDGTGTVRLVSFTPGGESGTSTPFHMDGAGNWRADLTVRGATYSFIDLRTGERASVDCTIVQCGVLTIGAHGKASRTNELFTPIDFVDATGTPIVPSDPDGAGAGGSMGVSGANAPVAGSTAGAGGVAGIDGDAVTTTTVAPAKVGSVGEAPTTTERTDIERDDELLEADETAAVQDFGDDDGGGGGAGMVAGAAALVLVVLVGGAAAVLRRRSRAAGEVS